WAPGSRSVAPPNRADTRSPAGLASPSRTGVSAGERCGSRTGRSSTELTVSDADSVAVLVAVPSHALYVSLAVPTNPAAGTGRTPSAGGSFSGVTVTDATSSPVLNGVEPPTAPATVRSARAPAVPRVRSQARQPTVAVPWKSLPGRKRTWSVSRSNRALASET